MAQQQQQKRHDPFFDVDEYSSLVGVANIFLKALFYDSKLDYLVPIINTQGEVIATMEFDLDVEQRWASQVKMTCLGLDLHISEIYLT